MAKQKKDAVKATERDFQVIIKPVVTEKTAGLGTNKAGCVVFKVQKRATKDRIKKAVERIFNVEVDKVNTAIYRGKVKRTIRAVGKRPDYKKAFVTLKEGYTIDIVEGV